MFLDTLKDQISGCNNKFIGQILIKTSAKNELDETGLAARILQLGMFKIFGSQNPEKLQDFDKDVWR